MVMTMQLLIMVAMLTMRATARLFECFARPRLAVFRQVSSRPAVVAILLACRLSMGAHVSVTRLIWIVGEGFVDEINELEAAFDPLVVHLREIHESQVVNRCFYVDLFRASRRIFGQPDNHALQGLQ